MMCWIVLQKNGTWHALNMDPTLERPAITRATSIYAAKRPMLLPPCSPRVSHEAILRLVQRNWRGHWKWNPWSFSWQSSFWEGLVGHGYQAGDSNEGWAKRYTILGLFATLEGVSQQEGGCCRTQKGAYQKWMSARFSLQSKLPTKINKIT